MTSEIVIITNNNIVMAADSVVTVGNWKTYEGVEKLFFLSNKPPMGMMIYGSANFEDVHMETLIKEFRNEFDFDKKGDIEKIKEGFLEFMAKNTPPTDMEKLVTEKMSIFKYEVKNNYPLNISNKQEIPEYLDEIKELNDIEDELKELIPTSLSENEKTKILEKLKEDFLKFFISDSSGIVIAGFNKKSHFPSCIRFEASFNYNWQIKIHNEQKLINNKGSFILPLAQSDVIITFITGIDEDIEDGIIITVEGIIKNYIDKLETNINNNTKIDKNSLKEVNKEINLIKKDYGENRYEIKKDIEIFKYINLKPILGLINSLPKEELANMAEHLINITSLKRKITPNIESVGGFVDVAIISKGDGFIWKKKKTYFDNDLNPHYKENY